MKRRKGGGVVCYISRSGRSSSSLILLLLSFLIISWNNIGVVNGQSWNTNGSFTWETGNIRVLGQRDSSTCLTNYSIDDSHFSHAVSLAYVNSKLFVEDDTNQRVLVFDTARTPTNGQAAIAVVAASSFTSVGPNELYNIRANTNQGSNYLWVGDGE